ncbi:receptor-type tyrosine-protein phosphatase kappa-like isoform X3 [Pomacea canaliculata]|uniref:receptor-type tyrosine-protein phosphatase kappa-like isoform X3 n=1 Tax=Pomacea canaliculata TaxID=400727 RepID=UPI000D73EEF2|nr:receptor-type tyrosine-protein phosphatase kappa-like isoform X3 [Pomacea canaliculata]
MAGRVCVEMFRLLVFTDILFMSAALNTHMHNVALDKVCNISSRHVNRENLPSGNCSAAINGNTNTVLNLSITPPNCIHTALNDSSPFWWVDLRLKVAISVIAIYGRTNFINRMICVNVSLDGKVLKRFSDTNEWSNSQYDISVGRRGRVVNITKDCSSDGFMINICEVQVWVCDNGWYGDNCTQVCGHCGGDSFCDKKTGSCTSCQTGFQLPLCRVCADGWYGDSCTQTCGHCADSSVCDKVNGSCTSCQTGFQPPLCQECADGWYGANCTQTCGNCFASVCNKVSGNCTSCKVGFQQPLCKECAGGWYGGNCTKTCGNCAAGSFCDNVNGTCVSCKTGFNPPFCTECQDGWYGNSCAETCGHCMGGNSTCHKTNGSCPSCDGEFQLPLCKESMKLDQTKSSGAPVGSIVGPVLAVIVAAVVVVIVVVWLRRRHQAKGNPSRLMRGNTDNRDDDIKNVDGRTGNKPVAPVKPQMHPKYEASDTHLYGNLCEDTPNNVQSTSVMTSVNTTNGGDENAKSYKSQATKERTDNRIYENVDLKTNPPTTSDDTNYKKSSKLDTERETKDPTDEEEESIYNTEDIYASYRSLGPSSILDDLQKSLLASLASGKLGMEFAEFSKDMQHPHEDGSKPENRNKNRFKALCAYDHSRVVLRWPKGDNNSDYINANYIKGCKQDKAYIATQGPRSNTVSDLWWMVWQDNVTQIIMLTNLKEGGKDKCEEYWPPVGTTKTYGHVTVTALKTDSRADFVIRHFVVENKKGGDQRTVSQYHYLVWPDHGVPSTYSLVSFWRYVKARAQGATPVVHCSAGVGRTGTYIALDIAADLRSRGRDVNVKDIVSGLREDRTLMVQTEEQYKFLHEVILEEHTSHGTRMTFDQFDIVFPSKIDGHNSRIDMEFKLLKEMGQFVLKPKHTIAESKENILKNRDTELLPDDSHLVYLMDRVPGRNQYINAIYVSSFRKSQGLILTQLPLPDTVVDMWRMIDGWDVNTIVSLGHRNQSKSVKGYCHYWPKIEKEVLETGQHTIQLISTSTLGDHLTFYNLSLMTKTNTPRRIRVMYYDDWAGVVPGSTSDILQLMDDLGSLHADEDTSPVVVQCNDGMTRSGMFCVLYEVINRARHDQEIDVYLSARHVQSRRPKAITTEAQYRYCYQVAQECKRQESIYQNT